MDQLEQGYVLMMTVMLYCVLVFLSDVKAQTTVEFAVDKTKVVIGETVTFQCISEGFDTTRDSLDIHFNGEHIIQYVEGSSLFFNGRSEMYYTIQELRVTNSKAGISLIINMVNVTDDGLYTCKVTNGINHMPFTSESIQLVVQYFPSPKCFVGNNIRNDLSLSNGRLDISRSGVNVTLICSSGTRDDDVYVGWDKSTEPRSDGMQSFSFISSQNDNGVVYTCTSSSASIANVVYQCKIAVFTSDVFKTTSAVPNRVITTETVPTTAVPTTTTTPLKTFPTPLKTTSKILMSFPSTKLTTDTTKVKTVSVKSIPKILTTRTTTSNSPTTEATNELPLALIVGASGITALLILIFVVILVCICVTNPRKRRRKPQSNVDNVHLVTQRPNGGINNRSEIDFVSDIALSTNDKRPLSRLVYQNGNSDFHDHVGEESIPISSSTTRFPPEMNYANHGDAQSVVQHSRNNVLDSHSIRNGSIHESVANTDTLNSHYSQSSRARHYSNVNESRSQDQVSYPPDTSHSLSDPPIYADVNKKKNKNATSEISGTSSLPAYAVVHKNRNGSRKKQNGNPPGVATKNQPMRRLQDADRPSSVRGRQPPSSVMY